MKNPEFVCGDTRLIRWVDSGASPTSVTAKVLTGSETVIDSAAMVTSVSGQSSLAGHYYHLHTLVNTPGWYVVETSAVISGKTYKNRETFRAVIKDVN